MCLSVTFLTVTLPDTLCMCVANLSVTHTEFYIGPMALYGFSMASPAQAPSLFNSSKIKHLDSWSYLQWWWSSAWCDIMKQKTQLIIQIPCIRDKPYLFAEGPRLALGLRSLVTWQSECLGRDRRLRCNWKEDQGSNLENIPMEHLPPPTLFPARNISTGKCRQEEETEKVSQ